MEGVGKLITLRLVPVVGATGRMPLGLEGRRRARVVAPVCREPEQLPGPAESEPASRKDGPEGRRFQ